jgi:hypothetical protein
MTQAMSIDWNTCGLRRAVFVSSPQPSGRTLQIRTGIAVET